MMSNSDNLFDQIKDEFTREGEMFETRNITDDKGFPITEYVSFPDNLKGYFDIGRLHGDKEFLIYENERFSFNQTLDKAAQFGNALILDGIQKGDRVAICMQNNPEFIFAYIGIISIGAVCVPLNSWWVADEIKYALEHSDAKVIVGDIKRLQGLEGVKDLKKIITSYTPNDNFVSFNDYVKDHPKILNEVEIKRDDNATIYYTSGSTGKPKGVLSSHRGIISTMFSWACISKILTERENRLGNDAAPLTDPDLSILLCVPLFHVTGSHVAFLMSVLVGRKVVMMKKWDAGEAIKLISEEKISDITGVPTQTWELLNHPDKDKYDLSSLKTLAGGGGPRPAEHVKMLDDNFEGRPGIGYGLTETNAIGTLVTGDDYVSNPSTAGRVVPPLTEIKILDENWNELEEGKIGEIAIKSQCNMVGYWKNEKATKECVNEEGWFKSGDLGKFDGPFLYILDRIKDMVIRGGENIACPEVEGAIYEHPDVLEASVFGIPDERLGEILCSAIFLREESDLNKDDLVEFLSDKLAAFKIPAVIRFLDSNIPTVASGKFDKPALRKTFIDK